MGNYQNTTGPRMGETESPTIGIRAHGLKGCLILLKNGSCQNCVLTIPLCRGGRDEATVENHVEIGRRKRQHAPAYASSSPGWADPTRIPDDPTHVPDPHEYDVIMTSACHVSDTHCHVISRQPS